MFRLKGQPKQHSKTTLMIMLIIFVCQFFAVSSAFSIQYPDSEHPFGQSISHHHSHSAIEYLNRHSHTQSSFNATESVMPHLAVDTEKSDSTTLTEHDHANHSHTPSDLPAESGFTSQFIHLETLKDTQFNYLNHHYAPPLPPPHS